MLPAVSNKDTSNIEYGGKYLPRRVFSSFDDRPTFLKANDAMSMKYHPHS